MITFLLLEILIFFFVNIFLVLFDNSFSYVSFLLFLSNLTLYSHYCFLSLSLTQLYRSPYGFQSYPFRAFTFLISSPWNILPSDIHLTCSLTSLRLKYSLLSGAFPDLQCKIEITHLPGALNPHALLCFYL